MSDHPNELIGYSETVLATLYNIEDHRPAYCDRCGRYHNDDYGCELCGKCDCDEVTCRFEDGQIKLPCINESCELEHFIDEWIDCSSGG